MATKPLTYTQQVAKFNADQAARHAYIMAALMALAPNQAPTPVDVTPVVTLPAPLQPGDIVDLGIWRRGRTGALPAIVRSPAQIAADKLMLPFDRSIAMSNVTMGALTYKPGDFASVGLTAYMGQTGDRIDIGLVTEAVADWLAGGSPNNMLAQAEAHGSVPVHQTIEGRVIDVLKHPLASVDQRGAKPYFDISQSEVKPDTPHYPALSYVAFLATGDLYYLAELQFAATYHISGSAVAYAQGKGILFPWQQRGVAWGWRDLVAATIATMEAEKAGPLPEPLLPSSYWKQVLDNNIAFYTARYVNGSEPLTQEMGFLACDDLRFVAPWQQDYISMVLGWAVWTGKVPQIKPLYDFQIRQAVKRATGPLRSQAIQYNWPAGVGKTWAESLAKNGKAATADGHYPPDSTREYAGYLRGVLKVAVMNSVQGSGEAFAYADAEAKRKNFIPLRWAV